MPILLVGIGLVVASLLNGAGFFMKRIGVMEAERYAHHSATRELWSIRSCDPSSKQSAAKPDFDYLYQAQGWERLMKAAKDLLFLGLILGLAFQVLRSPPLLPGSLTAWPLYLLLGAIAASAAASWLNFGTAILILAGLRSFLLVPIALGGRALASQPTMAFFACCMLLLAMLQLPLALIEAWMGLPIVREMCLPITLATRTSGSFVHPNSLGIFMAGALFFYLGYGPPMSRGRWLLVIAVVMLTLFLAGSATGLVVLMLGGGVWLDGRRNRKSGIRFYAALITGLLMLLVILPILLGRPDLFESVTGRFAPLTRVWELAEGPADHILGQGLGACTGTAITLFGEGSQTGSRYLFETDSTVALLLAQTGLLGATAFFGLLALLFVRDPRMRPFYLAAILSSLMINLVELFPLNLALGLSIASSLARTEIDDRSA